MTGPNAHREGFLHDIASLDASLKAARVLLLDVFSELDETVDSGGALTTTQMLRCHQINTHATRVALQVVRECFEWGGVAAIRPSPLQRCYLDMSVAALHLSQTRESLVGAGRELVAAATATR